MGSPWYSGKLTNEITLKAGAAQAIAAVKVDKLPPGQSYGLMACNIGLRLKSAKPVKFDYWMVRVREDDATAYNSETFPGGEDDFFRWPMWMGTLTVGETYRWFVRLERGLTGTLATRYAKGSVLLQPK